MKRITNTQVDQLNKLFLEGRLRGFPGKYIAAMSDSEAEEKINQAREVAPGTYVPISDEIRAHLKELSRKGVIELEESDLEYMTMATAYGLMWIAARQDRHRKVASELQCRKIRKMILMGFLAYMPNWKICLLQYEQAEKLIEEGTAKASLCATPLNWTTFY